MSSKLKASKITIEYPDRFVTLNTDEAEGVMGYIRKIPGVMKLNWKVKNKNNLSTVKTLDPDLKKILDQYGTLQLVNNDDELNIEFWETHLNTLSLYLGTEFEIKRWLTKHLGNINFWQRNNKRQSRTAKGLRARIQTWLMKEFRNLEQGKS